MIQTATQKDINTLLDYKGKMVIAMETYDSPITIDQIDPNQFKKRILKDLENPNIHYCLYLNDQKEAIGFLLFTIIELPVLIQNQLMLHIANLYVDHHARGAGIGRKLVQHAIKIGKQAGCNHIELSVFKDNPVQSLYEDLGFYISEYTMKKIL